MFKIIKIENEIVYVGKGDGEFTKIDKASFGFEPVIGDYVEFYKNGEEYIVSKVDHLAHFTGSISGQSTKSKTTAGILALILGAFGIYDFYIGKTGMGVLRIVISFFSIIPFLFPLIAIGNVITNLVVGISVLTSKPGSKWHKDSQGLELLD